MKRIILVLIMLMFVVSAAQAIDRDKDNDGSWDADAGGTDRDLDNDGSWDYEFGGTDRDVDNDGSWDMEELFQSDGMRSQHGKHGRKLRPVEMYPSSTGLSKSERLAPLGRDSPWDEYTSRRNTVPKSK